MGEERINMAVPTDYNGVELTEEEKDAVVQNFKEQANTWVDCQVKMLLVRLRKLQMRLSIGVRVWQKRADRYVSMVKKRYAECLAKKEKQVAAYKEYLQERINAYRSHLE